MIKDPEKIRKLWRRKKPRQKYSTKDHFALLPCIYVTKMPLYIPLSLKKKATHPENKVSYSPPSIIKPLPNFPSRQCSIWKPPQGG